mgnify:FL=1
MKKIKQESKRFKQLIGEQLGTGFNCETSATATIPCWTPKNEPGDPHQSIQVDVTVGGCECVNNQFGAGQFPDLLSCQAALPGCCSQAKKGVSIFRCEKDVECKEEKYPNAHAAKDILTTERGVYKTKKECYSKCRGVRKDVDKDMVDNDKIDKDVVGGIEELRENFYSQYSRLFLTEQKGGNGAGGTTTRACKTSQPLIPNPTTPCEQCGYHDTQQSNSQFSCWSECPTPLQVTVTCPVTSGLDCTNFPIVGSWATNSQGQDECWVQGGGGPIVGGQLDNTNVWSLSEPTCANSQTQVVCWTNCTGMPPNVIPSQSQSFPAGTICGTGTSPYNHNYDVVCSSQQSSIRCYTGCPDLNVNGGVAWNSLFNMNFNNNTIPCWDQQMNQGVTMWTGTAWVPAPHQQNPYCVSCWGCNGGTAVQVNVPGWSGGMPCSQISNQALGPNGYVYPVVYDDQTTAQANC